MGINSRTPFSFISRLVKILKLLKTMFENWNGITCNSTVSQR